jgi:hypothetical protein
LIGDALQNAKNGKFKLHFVQNANQIRFGEMMKLNDNKKILSRRHQAISSFRRYGNNVAIQ